MIPTTALESMPPLRKAPSGTSEISRRSTASSSSDAHPARGRSAARRRRGSTPSTPATRRLPVALDRRGSPPGSKRQHVPGREAADPLEERARGGHVAEGQVGGDRARVEPPRHRRDRRARALISLAEDEPAAARPVVERLLARPGRGRARAARGARPRPRRRTCRRGGGRARPASSSSARWAITSVSPSRAQARGPRARAPRAARGSCRSRR